MRAPTPLAVWGTARPPLKAIIGHGAVSTTHIEELALLRGRANTACISAVCRSAALRLGDVVLEHKEVIRADLKCRTI